MHVNWRFQSTGGIALLVLIIRCHYYKFARDRIIFVTAYSCFEKGCPTKPYVTMPKCIMGNGGLWSLIEALGVSAT